MKCPDCGVSGDHSTTCSWWNVEIAPSPLDRIADEHRANALGRLRQAIIDNTQGDLFWIGEILLAELEKETGFNGTVITTAPEE